MFFEMKTCIDNKKSAFGAVFYARQKLPWKRSVGYLREFVNRK